MFFESHFIFLYLPLEYVFLNHILYIDCSRRVWKLLYTLTASGSLVHPAVTADLTFIAQRIAIKVNSPTGTAYELAGIPTSVKRFRNSFSVYFTKWVAMVDRQKVLTAIGKTWSSQGAAVEFASQDKVIIGGG